MAEEVTEVTTSEVRSPSGEGIEVEVIVRGQVEVQGVREQEDVREIVKSADENDVRIGRVTRKKRESWHKKNTV